MTLEPISNFHITPNMLYEPTAYIPNCCNLAECMYLRINSNYYQLSCRSINSKISFYHIAIEHTHWCFSIWYFWENSFPLRIDINQTCHVSFFTVTWTDRHTDRQTEACLVNVYRRNLNVFLDNLMLAVSNLLMIPGWVGVHMSRVTESCMTWGCSP